nr:hypothetical protein Itr_chr09CG07030 [Ipomoea trifida]GMD83839.1 hypothetical protein Iba_chr14aCG8950 [Ipomoea batatas]GMD89892.1 hypothetical protein Iba_chr14dCG4410 [Ipomoea batatas]
MTTYAQKINANQFPGGVATRSHRSANPVFLNLRLTSVISLVVPGSRSSAVVTLPSKSPSAVEQNIIN